MESIPCRFAWIVAVSEKNKVISKVFIFRKSSHFKSGPEIPWKHTNNIVRRLWVHFVQLSVKHIHTYHRVNKLRKHCPKWHTSLKITTMKMNRRLESTTAGPGEQFASSHWWVLSDTTGYIELRCFWPPDTESPLGHREHSNKTDYCWHSTPTHLCI